MSMSAEELMHIELDRIIKDGRLESWNAFVEELMVPADLAVGLMSGRAELVKLVTPRQLSPAEHGVYLKIIGGLMDTNRALRQHAEQLGKLTSNWAQAFKALHAVGSRIERFASFQRTTREDADEEDDA